MQFGCLTEAEERKEECNNEVIVPNDHCTAGQPTKNNQFRSSYVCNECVCTCFLADTTTPNSRGPTWNHSLLALTTSETIYLSASLSFLGYWDAENWNNCFDGRWGSWEEADGSIEAQLGVRGEWRVVK